MQILNLSNEQDWKLFGWLPHSLQAEKVVFLPDACPGRSPLPTGTAVVTRQSDWRRFAISDCGCGMRLLRTNLSSEQFTTGVWDRIADELAGNKGKLGDLGGGNHFLDALIPSSEEGVVHFLIHTGSRQESGLVDDLVESPEEFDSEFERIVAWAESNRETVQKCVEKVTGQAELLLDLPHNTFEQLDDGVIIRKGAVRTDPGDLNIIPSNLNGLVALVRATDMVTDTLCSHPICNPIWQRASRRDL